MITIFLLTCLLFLGLILMMTLAHTPRAKEIGLGFICFDYKVKFHKKKSRM